MIKENFIKLYETSFRDNWELPALSDYGKEDTFHFYDVARKIAYLHIIFEQCQVKKGDKIALTGKDCAHWGIIFLATVTYGAVIVPILDDFSSSDKQHIINHSDSVLLFSTEHSWMKLACDRIPAIQKVFISAEGFPCIYRKDGGNLPEINNKADLSMNEKYPDGFTKDDIKYPEIDNSELVEINYTSGTTGFSKGVMLSANNLAANVTWGMSINRMKRGEVELCFLPLAHVLSCAFNLLAPMVIGAHVHILNKRPTPTILLEAFGKVKPRLMITVPLILEKIYKNALLPKLNKPVIKFALKIPVLQNLIYSKIRKQLYHKMGGNFIEVIQGGAPINQEVAEFLYKIKFPIASGYGMTECGPMIGYSGYEEFTPTSSVHLVRQNMELRIDSNDPYNEAGEIQVRGEYVMLGYYKNEEATRNAFTEDGWLKTGDIGTTDEQNRIFIKGRSKSMILSSSGQNIYPEELESKLNNLPYIMESIVIERNKLLIALVYPDYEKLDREQIQKEDIPHIMETNRMHVNKMLAIYEQIRKIELHETDFVKTPKNSIKRYLYQNA
ncbi:MAG: AMP-binding protein [Tannerella sp.]|jgi:long-chain acyl-CoA synthetase|nr:AMP-binding protein [Tannerella sp.]